MKRIELTIIIALVLFLFVQMTVGCAPWGENWSEKIPPRNDLSLIPNATKPNVNSFELVVAQLNAEQRPDFEDFWSQLDQQHIPLELRKRLDQNGLRCALMTNHTPAILNSLLEPKPLEAEILEPWQRPLLEKGLIKPASRLVVHRRIQLPEGVSKNFASSPSHPQKSWLVRNGDQQSFGAGVEVQGSWDIESVPNGDGSVTVILNPVILHGESRAQIGVSDGNFMMQNRQDKTLLENLVIRTRLSPGETLVIAPGSASGESENELGGLFFAAGATRGINTVNDPSVVHLDDVENQSRILLIRLVASPMDDLFRDRTFNRKLSDIELN